MQPHVRRFSIENEDVDVSDVDFQWNFGPCKLSNTDFRWKMKPGNVTDADFQRKMRMLTLATLISNGTWDHASSTTSISDGNSAHAPEPMSDLFDPSKIFNGKAGQCRIRS